MPKAERLAQIKKKRDARKRVLTPPATQNQPKQSTSGVLNALAQILNLNKQKKMQADVTAKTQVPPTQNADVGAKTNPPAKREPSQATLERKKM